MAAPKGGGHYAITRNGGKNKASPHGQAKKRVKGLTVNLPIMPVRGQSCEEKGFPMEVGIGYTDTKKIKYS